MDFEKRKKLVRAFIYWCESNECFKSLENFLLYLYLNGYINEAKLK